MWSHLRALVRRRAAAFCTDCTFLSRFSGTPYRSELHQSKQQAINTAANRPPGWWGGGWLPLPKKPTPTFGPQPSALLASDGAAFPVTHPHSENPGFAPDRTF